MTAPAVFRRKLKRRRDPHTMTDAEAAPPELSAGHTEATSQVFMDALAAAEPAGEPEWYAIGDPDPVLGAPPSHAAGPTVTCALVRVGSVARAWAEAVRRCAALRRYVAHCRNLVAVSEDEIATFDDFLDVLFETDLAFPTEHEISLVTSSSDLTRATKRARP